MISDEFLLWWNSFWALVSVAIIIINMSRE